MTTTILVPDKIKEILLSYQKRTNTGNITEILNDFLLNKQKEFRIAKEKAELKKKIIQEAISSFVIISIIQILYAFFSILIGVPPIITDFYILKMTTFYFASTSYFFFKKYIFPKKNDFKVKMIVGIFLSLLSYSNFTMV